MTASHPSNMSDRNKKKKIIPYSAFGRWNKLKQDKVGQPLSYLVHKRVGTK